MRRVGVLLVITCLLGFSVTANATRTWVSGNVGNWNDTVNWNGGALPSSGETAQVNNGTANLDTTATTVPGILLMGAASTDVGILNVKPGANLNVYKASSEIFCLIKAGTSAGGSATVNQTGGTVRIGLAGTANGGTCETRLVTASTTLGTAAYNLSGGILDTDVLSKGNKTNTAATFTATGGTLVLRNMIYRFGKASEGAGFNQGAATLEVGAVDTVAAISVGNSTNAMDYTVDGGGGTINIDIASASSYDKISQFVDTSATGTDYANLQGATITVDLLGGFVPTVNSFFDVWTYTTAGMATPGALSGSGTVNVPTGWQAEWKDLSGDGVNDTLRLTYIPEPATIALFGLGLLAIRRNKK